MTDYANLIPLLRLCSRQGTRYGMAAITMADAADAIEHLNHLVDLNTERCEGLRKQLREAQEGYEKHLNELEAQLPKRGEWIRHPEVKNIYGGEYIECPFCGEKYVVQYIADEKFCRNCGADLRAKMEVQDGK